MTRADQDRDASGGVLALTEEQAVVEKVDRVSGRVVVSTRTDAVEEMVHDTVTGVEVEVTRVPVDRVIEPGEPRPAVRSQDGLTIVPVLEEIIVVEKRLVLKEELHIREIETREDVEAQVTLLRQRAVVERTAAGDEPYLEQRSTEQ